VEQEEQPPSRRLVGIDLGIASRYSVRVLEADGRVVCRSSCANDRVSGASGRNCPASAPEDTWLAVVFEPTGPAWLPIAVFFARRGHDVYRVSSAKAADLRRFLRRHAKSNGTGAGPAGEATLPAPDPHDPAPRPSTPPPDHPAASPARPRRQRARWHAQNSERTGWDGLTRKGP